MAKNRKSIKAFVGKYLVFEGRCRRHCERPTSFVELQSASDNIVGAYVCPDNYVSRVVYFSANPNLYWFKDFLISQVDGEIVENRNIRPATRHGWELGKGALEEIGKVSPTNTIREVYWTVHFKAEDSRGVFLCSDPEREKGCKRLFVQNLNSRNRLCPKCR